jgi:hypothetical protein
MFYKQTDRQTEEWKGKEGMVEKRRACRLDRIIEKNSQYR